MGAVIRIGISGWTYPRWRGEFYPPGLVHRRELSYAAEQLTSIEINGTFYALQRPDSFTRWGEETPADFVFAVKGGRYITHLKRLREVRPALANFFASGVLALGPKLGPLLWQLPPQLAYDAGLIEDFLALLPRTAAQAARLGAEHDDKLDTDRVMLTPPDPDLPLRHAIEVRHDSFTGADFARQLRTHQVAGVLADTAGRWPKLEHPTADFVYLRLHGDTELYTSGYDRASLQRWAERIAGWNGDGLDVFAYFDNDVKVRAPFDAITLIELCS